MQAVPERRWEVGRFRRSALPVAIAFGIAVTAAGPVLVLGSSSRSPVWFTVGFCVFWLLVGGSVVSLSLRDTTRLVLGPDGRIEARRPMGTLRTDAGRVTRVTLSVWGESRREKPIVIATADGNVLLTPGFPDRAGVVDALRAHNPDIAVDL